MSYLFKNYAGIYDSFMKRFRLDTNEEILKHLGTVKGKKILDIGGGTGTLANLLQHKGADVTLVDPCQEMINQVSRKNKHIHIYANTLQDLEGILKKNTFDRVILRDALHHIKNPEEIIALSREYLQAGGEILIWEFNGKQCIAKIIWCFELLCFEKCHRFSKDGLRKLCEKYFDEINFIAPSSFEMLYQGKKREQI
ncbi:class I SAM-dependent methyltransferase [Niameybacter massiliensis]|uniref:class I SAM-dependent methyltransferase n=1 Tax=Niameybacter massiliensis TaxID=1658108 RepID=UPI0006B431B6|nr:class I SAM-dependent methyltransferase [Niameybacter massiliensis]